MTAPARTRLPWLDWQRGVAVLLMIEVHIVSAWSTPAATTSTAYAALQLLGGFAAPGFLFMAGLSQVLADYAQARKGVLPKERRHRAVRRGLYIVGVAYVFRVAEYFLGFAFTRAGAWRGILRVDILNLIGIALLISGFLVVGRPRRTQLLLAVLSTFAVVLLSPMVAALPQSLHLGGYVYMHGTRGFGLFNWGAFLFAGCATGVWVGRETRPGALLALGLGLFGLARLANHLPTFYADTFFWGTAPSWFAVRLGLTLAVSGALGLLARGRLAVTWLALLGRHSLLVYLLSVELTYGLLLRRLRHALELPFLATAVVLMTVFFVALCFGLEEIARHRVESQDGSRPRRLLDRVARAP